MTDSTGNRETGREPLRVGVVGYGYWGPNLARNFQKLPSAAVTGIADTDEQKLSAAGRQHPHARLSADAGTLLDDPNLDAVVIATPTATHHDLARTALDAGKHVLVTKPLAQSSEEVELLIARAEAAGRVLMVDHTFIYTGAVRTIRELIASGKLGDIFYCDAIRINLGLIQRDVNVLWDLGPHDLSILDYWFSARPTRVAAVGIEPVTRERQDRESVVYLTVWLEDGTLAHFHLSWLSPVKIRRSLIAGSRKMVVYDHLDPDYQVKIYDKGVDIMSKERMDEYLVQYRVGDVFSPKVDQTEALETECRHFVDCCDGQDTPITGGASGLRVLRTLEAAQESIRRGGEVVNIES